jgi:hypothetical protein
MEEPYPSASGTAAVESSGPTAWFGQIMAKMDDVKTYILLLHMSKRM